MADVFLVMARGPERVERLAVLKQLRHPGDAELTQMFLDEARLAVRLNHPNIVHTYEVGEAKGEYFITMEYLEGQPLSDVMSALTDHQEGLSDACVATIASQALKGLHYAHEFCDFDGTPLGVVHRDVSPHNLYVTYTGEVKVLDFGIAKAVLNSTRTESGILKGKLRYMSPEQAAQKDIDRRADIFAFGVILWELLARKALFSGDAISVLSQLAALDVPKLRSIRPEISEELEAIVSRSLAREPEDRYPSAEAMRLDLQRVFGGAGEDANAALSRLMNDLFATKRDALRSQIRLHISRGGSGADDTSSQPSLNLKAELPTLIQSATEPGASLIALTTGQRRTRFPRRWIFGGAAAVLGIVGVLGLLATSQRKSQEARPAVVPVTGLPAASAPPEAPQVVHVHLETAPPGAFVEWNGERSGPTPLDLTVSPGNQKLTITRSGYTPQVLTIDAHPGEDLARAVALEALTPSPGPSTAPAGGGRGTGASHGGRHDLPSHATHAAASAPTPAASASTTNDLKVRMIDEGEGK
jgi:serine/threonine-protein kinase